MATTNNLEDAVKAYNEARNLIMQGYVKFDQAFKQFKSLNKLDELKQRLQDDDTNVWVRLEELKEAIRSIFKEIDHKQASVLNDNTYNANVVLPDYMSNKTLEELLNMKRNY